MRVWLLIALLLGALPLRAATTGPGAYKIGGIAVDVAAKTPLDARAAAFREAQRQAWPQLWARITGDAASSAPHLADPTIESMVAGVEIESERFSTTRYIGRLAIVFDRARAAEYLGGASGSQAPPMLLLAVMIDGGTRTLYQAKTPWVAAWVRFREAASALDYVIPAGSAGDNVVLTSYQAHRPDRATWRNILNRFRAVDVVEAEVILTRTYPGGPVSALAIARHGPDAIEMGRVSLRTGSTAGLDAMLDEAVRQVDGIYARAMRDGRMQTEKGLITELEPLISGSPDIGGTSVGAVAAGGVDARVVTPDAASWTAVESLLRGTPTVTGVTVTSLSLGGTSRLVIRYGETREMLDYQLDQRGLRLVPAEGGALLRRRQPGDAPVPKPLTTEELNAAQAIGEPDEAGMVTVPAPAPGAARASGRPAAPAARSAPSSPAKPAAAPAARAAAPPPAKPPATTPPKPATTVTAPRTKPPVDLLPQPK